MKPEATPRFPLRTLVLMVLALMSFAWFFYKTHQVPRATTIPVRPVPSP